MNRHEPQLMFVFESIVVCISLTRLGGDAMNRTEKALLAIAALSAAAATMASETITYTYDTRGRLARVEHSGTANSGVNTSFTYDKADNRTNMTTTGAGAAGAGAPATASEEPILPESSAPALELPSDPPAPDPGAAAGR